MLDVLTSFVGHLRAAGLPVSLTETVDALEAVRHSGLHDRGVFRTALASTLVKRPEHRATFDLLFEVFFSPGARSPATTPRGTEVGVAPAASPGASPPEDTTALAGTDDLAAHLDALLAGADDAQLARFARLAVDRYGGLEPGRPPGPAHALYRTLRALDLDGALERVAARAGASGESAFEARLRLDERRSRAERLQAAVEAEIRRRLVDERGPEAVARALRRPLPEDVDFMHATREELAALDRAIRPLARKLAVRLARRRRHRRRGAVDFRRTARHSLSTGGVPVEPRFRHQRPARPELMVVADVSGSVAAFARFTLQFVYAVASQFSRVRSFVFIDGIDEVTHLLEGADDLAAAMHRVNTEADVVWADGHSDYGHALLSFRERWGSEVTPKTSLIVLGDARNNYHPSEAWVLAELRAASRHLWWLNPEPRSYWDTGDSIVSEYSASCDGFFECRTLRQLERFVEAIAA